MTIHFLMKTILSIYKLNYRIKLTFLYIMVFLSLSYPLLLSKMQTLQFSQKIYLSKVFINLSKQIPKEGWNLCSLVVYLERRCTLLSLDLSRKPQIAATSRLTYQLYDRMWRQSFQRSTLGNERQRGLKREKRDFENFQALC